MSRRIQCNSLSVKARGDGSVPGTVECDVLNCKDLNVQGQTLQELLSGLTPSKGRSG